MKYRTYALVGASAILLQVRSSVEGVANLSRLAPTQAIQHLPFFQNKNFDLNPLLFTFFLQLSKKEIGRVEYKPSLF